jgi:RES domain-containing protein
VLIDHLDITPFGQDWHKELSIPVTASAGTLWAKSLTTAALRVPSAAIRTEFNYILNPLHPQFSEIKFAVPSEEIVDPRLRG